MITLQHSFLSLNFISSRYCYCCGYCSVGIGRLMIFTASAQPKAHASTSSLLLFTVRFHAHIKHPNQQHNARWSTTEGLNGRSLALIYLNTALLLLAASVMPLMMNSHKAAPRQKTGKKTCTGRPKTRFPKLARINSIHENFNLFNHIYFFHALLASVAAPNHHYTSIFIFFS